MNDPIQARLAEIATEMDRREALMRRAFPSGAGGQAIFPDVTHFPLHALSAVLSLSESMLDPEYQRAVRRVVAEHLGVIDD